jgi:hypothetical protein
MRYFNRLADRLGPATAPIARPAAIANSRSDQSDAGDLQSFAEMPAPATIAQPAEGGHAASAPLAPTRPTPAPQSDGRLRPHDDSVAPGPHSYDLARETMPPTAREWVTLDSAIPSQGSPDTQQSIALLDSRETVTTATSPIVSRVSRPHLEAETASRLPQAAAIEPAIHMLEPESEALPRTETGVVANASRAGGGNAAVQMSSPLALPQAVREAEDDCGVAALRVAPMAQRSGHDHDTTARRHDRAATPAPHVLMGRGPPRSTVEVRIGAVTLQVHAPAPPAVPQAPVRSSFAPHRHYLRTW